MRYALLIALFLAGSVIAATPTLGTDCGVGATIDGSKNAGKVTLGIGADSCTLTFSTAWPKVPSCAATDETNARPVDAITTTTTVMFGVGIWTPDGDVISYLCVGQ